MGEAPAPHGYRRALRHRARARGAVIYPDTPWMKSLACEAGIDVAQLAHALILSHPRNDRLTQFGYAPLTMV